MTTVDQLHSDPDTMGEPNGEGTEPAGLLSLRQRLPRLETAVLALALTGVGGAKLYAAHRLHVDHLVWTWLTTLPSDFVFFGLMAASFSCLHALSPSRAMARLILVATFLIAGYTAVDFLWTVGTGSQVHPEVVTSFLQDPHEFGNVVGGRMWRSRRNAAPFLIVTVLAEVAVLFRLLRPIPSRRTRRVGFVVGGLFAVAALGAHFVGIAVSGTSANRPKILTSTGNAHWLAITSFFRTPLPVVGDGRTIARRGERPLTVPNAGELRPHVVIVVMESAAHWTTSFGGQPADQTPTLTQLAARGAYFPQTRARVTHTTKSLFAMLTGVCPSLEADVVETVAVETPYESLATILQARGYRSRFSQMARGSFECRPGLMANLGFDSFFARENLEDPTKHIGYLGGDDFAMIEPTFSWLDKQEAPCLLVLLTSVAHDPYEVPAWFAPPVAGRENALLQTIRYTDRFVAEVLAAMEERDMTDNTLVCVLGDHGEGVGRRGIRGHDENPYEEALRIPWIVAWPGHVRAGTTEDSPHSTLDVTPTLLTLLGYGIERAGFDGSDALGQPVDESRRVPFSGWYANSPTGYVEGHRKVVYWPGVQRAFRFDLAADPMEENPIPIQGPQLQALAETVRRYSIESRITFNAQHRQTHRIFEHWQRTSVGENAWAYYDRGN